jgi:glycerol uptake facilitator-like aquaporin
MEKRAVYIVSGLLGAVLVAAVLYLLFHDVFGFRNRNIVIYSMGVAGVLCILFSVGFARSHDSK